MRSVPLATVMSAVIALAAGCSSESSSFARVDSHENDDTATLEDGAPISEDEMLLIATGLLFERERAEDEVQTASLMERTLDAFIPSAYADVNEDHPSGCDAPPPTQSWIDVDMSGPAGSFGSPSNALDANRDTSYCENSQGQQNAGWGLAKWFTVTDLQIECSNGQEWTLSLEGPVVRVGTSNTHRVYGEYDLRNDNAQGVPNSTQRCTIDVDTEVSGSNDALGEGLNVTGHCGAWTALISSSQGDQCWINE